MLKVICHDAKFRRARITPAAKVAKNVEFLLSVCSSKNFERHRLCARICHEGTDVQKRF